MWLLCALNLIGAGGGVSTTQRASLFPSDPPPHHQARNNSNMKEAAKGRERPSPAIAKRQDDDSRSYGASVASEKTGCLFLVARGYNHSRLPQSFSPAYLLFVRTGLVALLSDHLPG